jgi:hypothetical protein
MTEHKEYCTSVQHRCEGGGTVGGGSNSLPVQLFDQLNYLKNVF